MNTHEYLDEDEERAPRSILTSGWFRAVVALGVLAVVLTVSLPYVLRWFDSGAPATQRQATRPAEPRPAPHPTMTAAPSPPAFTPTRAPIAPVGERPAPMPEKIEAVQPPAEKPPSTPDVARAATARVARSAEPTPGNIDAPSPASLRPSASGNYWVQVGAFQEERNAERLAATLREHRMPAEVTRVSRGAVELPKHEVFVSGATAEAVGTALRGTGATARVVAGGVAVQPPVELKDAVAMSRRLSGAGLAVKIRRVDDAGGTLHVVRVGGYPSRPRAETARQELHKNGLGGFIAQGPAR
jgi:cell division septation protein DedD